MKKSMFVVGVVAAAFSLVAMTSCELKMGDEDNRFSIASIEDTYQGVTVGGISPVYASSFQSKGSNSILGNGKFVLDSVRGVVYQNGGDGSAKRTHALQLDAAAFEKHDFSEGITIGFWVKKGSGVVGNWLPLFTAYKSTDYADPCFLLEFRLVAYYGHEDSNRFISVNDTDANAGKSDWLNDGEWHYYTFTATAENAAIYVDGKLLKDEAADLRELLFALPSFTKIYLGGMQYNGWDDADTGFLYSNLSIYNKALTEEQIIKVMNDKED